MLVTATIQGLPASGAWVQDDGRSTGPTQGNGENGGDAGQVLLVNGVNSAVSDATIRAFLNSSVGAPLAAFVTMTAAR